MTTFALIGAAGYVAPRHMRAMKAVGGNLLAAYDPNDSVGIIDSFFPSALYFKEFELFEDHIEQLRRCGHGVEQVAICSPNYLHETHCRSALRADADVICEKPLVLDPREIDVLAEVESATTRRISTILQLRLHPTIIALKQRIDASAKREFAVDLTYITARGPWYYVSWKGDESKSGGITTNIGIHLFDLMLHLFGRPLASVAHLRDGRRAAGHLVCERASIRWFVSTDRADLLRHGEGASSYRAIAIDDEVVELSDGFADLHTRCYEEICAGRGFGLETVRPSIELVSALRSSRIEISRGERHPMTEGHLSS